MKNNFRVMTYNVRRCTGLDGRVSPERIAKIISNAAPDIVALQEVDVGRRRTGFVDQPKRIAELTGLQSTFFARIKEGSEEYGIAVLSRHPTKLIKADWLSAPVPPNNEGIGAIWLKVAAPNGEIQFIATHFNHSYRDRIDDIQLLASKEWVSNSECRAPVILCGDFNTTRRSPIYDEMSRTLNDAQKVFGQYHKTWPSIWPLMRIDHIFISKDVNVRSINVPSGPTVMMASDHRPLIADLSI